MPEGIRNDLLDVLKNGERIYHQFRKNRFLEKNEKISDTIHRNNIKTFVSIKENQGKAKKVKEKTSKKDMVNAQKLIDLARVRNFNDKKLFEYNLVPSSYLFDADDLMVESGKSALVREIENMYLSKEHYTYSYLGEMKHSYLVDVMSNVRMKHSYLVDVMSNVKKLDVKNTRTFDELCKSFLSYVLSLRKNTDQVHFVFDSYIEGSVKDSERCRRYQSHPIDIHILADNTPIPVDMSTFWTSNKNKQKLQCLLTEHILKLEINCLILSAYMMNGDMVPNKEVKRHGTIDDVNVDIEEADIRLFPQAKYAVKRGVKKLVLLSNDTDVIVGLIYHDLLKEGLKELWFRAGVGTTTRYIPVHVLVNILWTICVNRYLQCIV